HGPADLDRVVIDDCHDPESLASEPAVVEERRAEIAESHQHDPPLAVESQDPLDLEPKIGRVVADSSDAEFPEVREVLPNLGRVQVEPRGELLRGDGLDAVLLQLRQTAEVHGQPPDSHLGDAGQATSGTRHARWPDRPDGRRAAARPVRCFYLNGFAKSKMIAMTNV